MAAPAERKREVRSGRPSRHDTQDRSALIFDAAIELLADRGFEATTIQDIADRANVAANLITHYFGSKQTLIERCNEHVLGQLRFAYAKIRLEIGDVHGAATIDRMTESMINVFTSRTLLFRYLRRLFVANDAGANLFFREYFQLVSSLIDRLDAAGELDQNSSRTWISFQFIFLQLGPAFLQDQIESIIGCDAYEASASEARVRATQSLLKRGIFAA